LSVGDVLKKSLNIWVLLSLFFVLPIILSLILVLSFKNILENDFVEKIVFTSGYLFTLSSLILVFILFNTFKVSDYKRSAASKKYLEKKAFDKLYTSLTTIKNCVETNQVKDLYTSCMTVRETFNTLKFHDSDVELKAYSNEIKAVVNLINKYKLSTRGLDPKAKELKITPVDGKRKIVETIDTLLWHLQQRSSFHEESRFEGNTKSD